MTDRILITGASGFVGRQVLRALAPSHRRIRVVARPGARNKLGDDACTVESFVETADLFAESADWWAQACTEVDTVIHLAWYAEPGKYLQSPQNIDCLTGTLQLAKGAAAAGVRRWVGVGTCAEYALGTEPLSIDTPLKPTTPYAAAKAAAYTALAQFLPSQLVQFAWCRLFYLYGEGEDSRRLVPYLRQRLAAGETAELTSGSQIRDFLDVAQAGRLIAQCAQGTGEGAFNVCSGTAISIRQLAERIADEYGARHLLNFGARPDNLFDPLHIVGVPNV